MKTPPPNPAVVPFRLNPQTGEIEWTVEGLKWARALSDDMEDIDDRLEALEP